MHPCIYMLNDGCLSRSKTQPNKWTNHKPEWTNMMGTGRSLIQSDTDNEASRSWLFWLLSFFLPFSVLFSKHGLKPQWKHSTGVSLGFLACRTVGKGELLWAVILYDDMVWTLDSEYLCLYLCLDMIIDTHMHALNKHTLESGARCNPPTHPLPKHTLRKIWTTFNEGTPHAKHQNSYKKNNEL